MRGVRHGIGALLLIALLTVAACAANAPVPGPPPPGASLVPPVPTVVAPPAPSSTVGAPDPVAGTTVVIDPGHNGGNAGSPAIDRPVPDGRGGTKPCNTTGASTDAGYPEHAFAWAVSQRVAERLRAQGVRVVLTRDSDDGVGPCVDERGRAGQRAGADAVLSVHADGGPPSGSGFHVLYSSPAVDEAQRGPARSFADDAVAAMRAGGFTPADYIGRGGLDPRDDIAGLNLATVPSVLVECANLRNAGDAATVRSPAGQDRYADALTDAVVRFLAGRR